PDAYIGKPGLTDLILSLEIKKQTSLTRAKHGREILNDSISRNRPNYLNSNLNLNIESYLFDVNLLDGEKIENLKILYCGSLSQNPSELLNSIWLKLIIRSLRKKFDYLIIDSPPILNVVDGLILAKLSDQSLIVVESVKTKITDLMQVVEKMNQIKRHPSGVIINKLKLDRFGFHDHFFSYKFHSRKY
ncbi:AAA family ATPase, partial [Desulfosarcina cetonica]